MCVCVCVCVCVILGCCLRSYETLNDYGELGRLCAPLPAHMNGHAHFAHAGGPQ